MKSRGAFSSQQLNFIRVNAQRRFGEAEGVTDPEEKRKLIGEEFVRVFEEEAGNWEIFLWPRERSILMLSSPAESREM